MYGCINDRGVCVQHFKAKASAKRFKELWNQRARAAVARGEWVTPRLIVGIAKPKRIKP